jgi:hypothetical protein
MTDNDASKLMNMIHGPSASTVYHPERIRKQRYSLSIATGGSGGVNDMEEVGCGKDWEHAFADMWRRKP